MVKIIIERDEIGDIPNKVVGKDKEDILVIDEVVKITISQYVKLVRKYPIGLVNNKIIELATYEHNRRKKYLDYYRTIDNWCRKDQ